MDALSISAFDAFFLTHNVYMKSPPNIMLLPPKKACGLSKISFRQRSRASKQRRSFIGASSRMMRRDSGQLDLCNELEIQRFSNMLHGDQFMQILFKRPRIDDIARSAVVNSGNASIYSCILGHLALHVKVIKKDGLPCKWQEHQGNAHTYLGPSVKEAVSTHSKQLLHTAETIALPEEADCSDSVDHVFGLELVKKVGQSCITRLEVLDDSPYRDLTHSVYNALGNISNESTLTKLDFVSSAFVRTGEESHKESRLRMNCVTLLVGTRFTSTAGAKFVRVVLARNIIIIRGRCVDTRERFQHDRGGKAIKQDYHQQDLISRRDFQ
ncbi:hypothetical protein Tco_1236653 [Tanacetum coccineum]